MSLLSFASDISSEDAKQGREVETIPIGIGPALAGWAENRPVYFFDALYADGGIGRFLFERAAKKIDPKAKAEAHRVRLLFAEEARAAGRPIVLAHDAVSFAGLVRLLAPATVRPAA
jgi:hypothetical protein